MSKSFGVEDAFGCFNVLFIGGLLTMCLWNFGSHWTIGRYFMPKAIVAESGRHYPDGEAIDGLTLLVVRSGFEEEIFLGLVLFFISITSYVQIDRYLSNKAHKKRMAELEASIRYWQKLGQEVERENNG